MISDGTLKNLIEQTPSLLYIPASRMTTYGPIKDTQIQPASVDVRLSHDVILHDHEYQIRRDLRDPCDENGWEGGPYFVRPGECVLGSLVERLWVPGNMVGWVEGKSTIGRQFLKVHSAGFIDPGFHGDITLELKNESSRWGFELKAGMIIAQLRFAYLDAPAVRPYGMVSLGSQYQMQVGTTEAVRRSDC